MSSNLVFLKPSAASNGGNQEIDYMISGLTNSSRRNAAYLCLFPLNISKPVSIVLYPFYFIRIFLHLCLIYPDYQIVLTHYSTYPFVFLAIFRPVSIFLQDIEWFFVSNRIFQFLIKSIVLSSLFASSSVIFANLYLFDFFTNHHRLPGVPQKSFLYPVPSFPLDGYPEAQICDSSLEETSILVVAKQGNHKCFDDYIHLSRAFSSFSSSSHFKFNLTVVTPSRLFSFFTSNSFVDVIPFQSKESFLVLLAKSHFFISLSHHEGFGINPLDSILCRCLPILRHNGGCSNFLQSDFPGLLPNDASVESVLDHLAYLDNLRRVSPNVFLSILDKAHDAVVEYLNNSLVLRDNFFRSF